MTVDSTAKVVRRGNVIGGIIGDGAITYYGVAAAYKESSPISFGSIIGNVAFGDDGIGIVKKNPSPITVVGSVIGYVTVDESWI